MCKVVADDYERLKGRGGCKVSVISFKSRTLLVSAVSNCKQFLTLTNSITKGMQSFVIRRERRDVQMRHQIDLMDMGRKGAIKLNGVSYSYILSVMDVFSRFVWLRPVRVERSKNIADELRIL